VPKHQDAGELRAARHRRRDPRLGAAVRAKAERDDANRPRANEAAFELAVDEVTEAARRLIASLHINAPPRNREEEARKARERSRERFA
jgi:hypothetical protein